MPTVREAPLTLPAVVELPVELDAGAPVVALLLFARAWKAEKLFALESFALMAKTIPDSQWLVCLQYAQMGVVSFTTMLNDGKDVTFAATGMNPESKPICPVVDVFSSFRHGSAKDD